MLMVAECWSNSPDQSANMLCDVQPREDRLFVLQAHRAFAQPGWPPTRERRARAAFYSRNRASAMCSQLSDTAVVLRNELFEREREEPGVDELVLLYIQI